MRRVLLVILIQFSLFLGAQAQLPSTTFAGTVSLFGVASPVVVDFRPLRQPGAHLGTMSLPKQGLHSMQLLPPAARVDDSLRFTIRSLPGHYVGKLVTTDSVRLVGFLLVAGQRLALTLHPTNSQASRPIRSQTPTPPLPYRELQPLLAGGAPGVQLAATLTAPSGKGPFPGVVLVSGSGPHNRDGEQFAHQPFRVLADALTRRGFAVLRYDERGVGQSTGDFATATTADFAADAAAAVAGLRASPQVSIGKVYLIGHSQGTLEIQRVAAADPTLAGLVLLGGIGQPMLAVYKERLRLQAAPRLAQPDTTGRADILKTRRVYEAVLDIIAASPDSAAAVAALQHPAPTMHIDAQELAYFAPMYLEHTLQDLLRQDPRPYLQKIRVPVLAVTGSLDEEAPASTQFAALGASLQHGFNPPFTSMIVPRVTHFFQTVSSGTAPSPYDNPETFSSAELAIVCNWLASQAGLPASSNSSK